MLCLKKAESQLHTPAHGAAKQAMGRESAGEERAESLIHAEYASDVPEKLYSLEMAQSLSHILIHVIFSTKDRAPLLTADIRPRLHGYLAKKCRDLKCECFRVGGVEDHVHLAIELPRTLALSKLLETLKATSSKWLKTKSPDLSEFSWQGGYGAFSLSFSHLGALCDYIDRQEEHHEKVSFEDEYVNLLEKLKVDYDPRYLWTP